MNHIRQRNQGNGRQMINYDETQYHLKVRPDKSRKICFVEQHRIKRKRLLSSLFDPSLDFFFFIFISMLIQFLVVS